MKLGTATPLFVRLLFVCPIAASSSWFLGAQALEPFGESSADHASWDSGDWVSRRLVGRQHMHDLANDGIRERVHFRASRRTLEGKSVKELSEGMAKDIDSPEFAAEAGDEVDALSAARRMLPHRHPAEASSEREVSTEEVREMHSRNERLAARKAQGTSAARRAAHKAVLEAKFKAEHKAAEAAEREEEAKAKAAAEAKAKADAAKAAEERAAAEARVTARKAAQQKTADKQAKFWKKVHSKMDTLPSHKSHTTASPKSATPVTDKYRQKRLADALRLAKAAQQTKHISKSAAQSQKVQAMAMPKPPPANSTLSCVCNGTFAGGDRVHFTGHSFPPGRQTGTVLGGTANGYLNIDWDNWTSGHNGNCQITTCGTCSKSSTLSRWFAACGAVTKLPAPSTGIDSLAAQGVASVTNTSVHINVAPSPLKYIEGKPGLR